MSTVKCGLKPVVENPEWEITTQEINDYLQQTFTRLTTGLRKNGMKIDDVKVKVVTQGLSKRYLMVILILPSSVVKGNSELEDIPSLFQSDGAKKNIILERPFWDLIRNWMYTNNEKAMLRNRSYRQQLQLNDRSLGVLLHYSNINYFDDRKQHVVVGLDPLKIIHDMLVDTSNPKERFEVWVPNYQKIEDGKHKLTVKRVIDTKHNRHDDISKDMQKALARAIRP